MFDQNMLQAIGPIFNNKKIGPNQMEVAAKVRALVALSTQIMLGLKCTPEEAIKSAEALTDGVSHRFETELKEAKEKDKEWLKRQKERAEKMRKLRSETGAGGPYPMGYSSPVGSLGDYLEVGDDEPEVG